MRDFAQRSSAEGPAQTDPVWRGLVDPLRRIRISAGANQALVVHTPSEPGRPTRVLAADSVTATQLLSNEPVHVSIVSAEVPGERPLVRLRSLMRPVRLDVGGAVIATFDDDQGRGRLIIGSSAPPAREADTTSIAHQLDSLRTQLKEVRHRDLDRAYKTVAGAATSDLSVDRIFDVVLASARNLMDSDVAYLSIPADDAYFVFSRTLGIRTGPFLKLRVGLGEGLGGAAREQQRTVRSLNYEADSKLRSAPRAETRNEGIYSAMAAPVETGAEIAAILYVASRQPHAYTEEDERLLADFTSATLLGLNRSHLEEHRRAVVREEERSRLAQRLHDDLVRRLTQIGFAAEELEHVNSSSAGRQHAEAISASVAECMSLVREELNDLLRPADPRRTTLESIAESIVSVPALSELRRTVEFASRDEGSVASTEVPRDIAEAMCRAGQEAVFNAERHSTGGHCSIYFDVRPGRCVLTVADDGAALADLSSDPGHHGIEFIQREIHRVGGEVTFGSGRLGGVEMTATFPVATAALG